MVGFGDTSGVEAHVVAPVAGQVAGMAGRVKGAVEDVWRGFWGSPTVPGGTNWNGYSHEEMHAMLQGGADPGQVGEQSAVMEGWASAAAGTADDVTGEARSVPAVWRGSAADNAVTTMVSHAGSGDEVRGHMASIAHALGLASEALSRARHAMPEPVAVGAITKYGAIAGGVGGAVMGRNPLSAAAGAFVGGAVSHFGASALDMRNKGHAIEVMQQYERDLQDALAAVTPAPALPSGPGDARIEELTSGTTSSGGGADVGSVTSSAGLAGSAAASPGSATAGLFTGASGFSTPDSVTGRSGSSLPPVGGPSALTSAAGSLGSPISAGVGTGRGFGGGGVGGAPGGGVPWRELTGRGALAGVMPGLLSGGGSGGGVRSGSGAVAGRGGRGIPTRGLAGIGGAPGMGAGGRGQRGEEDAEHRNKMPQEENLFAIDSDEVLAPPVLGDWANQE